MLERMTRFNKDTFSADRLGNLKQINLRLNMCLIDNDVRMVGVMRVKSNKCIAFNK